MRVWAFLLLSALCTPVQAQDASGPHATPTEAVELFRTAREHYRAGRYREAAADLERAVVLDPSSPTLRYNLARVYELSGDLEHALASYRRYLELIPPSDGEERERTTATIERLEGAMRSGERAPPTGPAQELRDLEGPVIVRERGVADLAFWLTMGGGGAALLAGAITGGLALDRAASRDSLVLTDEAGADAYEAQKAALASEARALAISTDVLIGVGGAALIAGLLLFVLREQEYEREMEEPRALAPFFLLVPSSVAGGGMAMIGVRGTL